MRETTQDALARLAFWARNMMALKDAGMEWPGFSYTDGEWVRMCVLAEAVTGSAFVRYVTINAVVFIAIAALGIVAVFLPLATLLFPVPAETGALEFALLLAACCFLIIGAGLPISLRVATAFAADRGLRERILAAPGDDQLARKVAWQINRITLILCGLLVPGILLFVAYDIEAGPLVTAIKLFGIALIGASLAMGYFRSNKR